MNIKNVIARMTLEEKASLCSGLDFWHLKPVERLGVESIMVSDGPHGLRKQDQKGDHLGINDSIEAVCFPAACGLASSFDPELLRKMGVALGNECQAEDVGVLLGPGINIKRSPLCGRNFEYYSEDPYLAGQLGAAFTEGVQGRHVGVSVKHFAANNQEERRMSVSAEIDERTLREIYLAAFEQVVRQAKPWTVMCSYNRINGEYVSQSPRLLTEILRKEWGFDGYVVTDWGACDDRVAGLAAGQDLEMPGSGGVNDAEIVQAVRDGRLKESVLDTAVERILRVSRRFLENRDTHAVFDRDRDHALARDIARQSMVLLKNEKKLLPLDSQQKVAFLGAFAKTPRYQGSGSSHINAHRVVGALEAAGQQGLSISYAPGYRLDSDAPDEALITEAAEAAKGADVAVVFAGLPESYESEGYDRVHMRMPESHNALIEAVAAVQPHCVVVLQNGSPVEMPWIDKTEAVLESYLGGEAVGEAQVDLLYGSANPCGKLAETFPLRLQDSPSYLNFPGEGDRVEYREGVFVGYRWYDSVDREVLFPFGHGLSYTSFEYSDLHVDRKEISGDEPVTVTLKVKNTGKRSGRETVQIYVQRPDGKGPVRPDKELRGFAKVFLAPGEEKEISASLTKRAFACYSTEAADWVVPAGEYGILAGASSRDIRLAGKVVRTDQPAAGWRVTRNTTLGDILSNLVSAAVLQKAAQQAGMAFSPGSGDEELGGGADAMARHMFFHSPLRAVRSFAGGDITNAVLRQLVDAINEALAAAEKAE